MNDFVKTIIIDDEEDGRLVLASLLKLYCPKVEVLGMFSSASEGIKGIEEIKPDLIFLDIDMPIMNGFSMLEKLASIDFAVIFVTAYNHYAIKAIKFSALDYLLKPIDEKELTMAVNKCIQERDSKENERLSFFIKNQKNDIQALTQMALPIRDGYIFANVNDIVRCEGDGNYTLVLFQNGEKQLVSKTLKEFETNLAHHNFVRIHKSHLINLKYVKKYTRGEGGSVLLTDNTEIEVSRRSKEAFLKLFNL